MFGKIAERLVHQLNNQNIISEDESAIYRYGLESLLIKILHTVTMILIGSFLGLLSETCVFLIAYSTIRVYAGGYHAKSKWLCYLWSWGTILSILGIIRFCPPNFVQILSLLLIFFGFVSIYLLAPVENSNKTLDDLELKLYGKRTKIVLGILTLLGLILTLGFQNTYGLVIALCLSLEGTMLILGKRKLKKDTV